MTTGRPASIGDVRRLAETAVSPDVWDFVEGGSGAELTLAGNRAAFDRVALLPQRHGCAAIVLTVDVPLLGRRLRDVRNDFTLPPSVRAVNLDAPDGEEHVRVRGTSAVATHTAAAFRTELTWRDLARLREWTTLPLVIKGILDPRDARVAVDVGVDAVVVSNHGGRQLDGVPPSVVALPAVLEEVGDACEVLLDSGVRGGTDVLRAVALGASGVLVGRPVLWGLAAAGEAGVRQVLALIHAELSEAMTLAGCADLDAASALRTTEVALHARHS
ncbi:MAG: alpha-hydroxy acid oxidase [Pseudonocardiaceae bacterium]